MVVNRFGLPRTIPEDTKRKIRQKCGFGCVVCGLAIYQYEHFDPNFADAQKHDPEKIMLLCGGCHDRVTRGLLSKQSVSQMAENPKCRENGFSFGPFDIGLVPPEIVLGSLLAQNVRALIEINGDELLSIFPPREAGQPFLINAWLCDEEGNEILRIVDNEWRTSVENWDVSVIGQRITIRNAPREISLVLRSDPPNRLVVERMHMLHKGARVTCAENGNVKIATSGGTEISAQHCSFDGCDTAIRVEGEAIAIGCGPRKKIPIHSEKIGRNSPCTCGSGRKYKHCHGSLV